MKSIVFLLTILITLPSLASIWTETVTCEFNRISEDNTVVKSDISANFTVQGTHNGEVGSIQIWHALTPSYAIKFNLEASGRYDKTTLTTINLNNEIVAKSSTFSSNKAQKLKNQFVSDDGNYIISIVCSNKTLQE